jgi:hypothetical protein
MMRTIYLTHVTSANDIDKTWNEFNVFITGVAELHLAIICACAPSLKYVFGRYFGDGVGKTPSARNRILRYNSTSQASRTGSGKTMQEQIHEEMDKPMTKYLKGKGTWYVDTETSCTGDPSRTVE